eukprot:CAMPEP_0115013620 /NCGR_PEP_ID=MMETSP0216-20121206/25528_1 /TAXON_ID=223996 /ORGANISM="Protocruzia adherens, Strain Boccale" /LENGTH=254 /DNA_ID=CAMNT_0002383077 /DNA_START=17 /DNA_END=781 /DNA_ORIENTATION=+
MADVIHNHSDFEDEEASVASDDSDLVALQHQEETKQENAEPEINDEEALKEKLEELKKDYSKKLKTPYDEVDWLEHMRLSSTESVELDGTDKNNDIMRELEFYNVTLSNVKEGIDFLAERGLRIYRPEDFFAEMLKSDHQMSRVRTHLVEQQTKMKVVEERTKYKEQKRYGKQIQVQRTQEKHREKRRNLEAINKWKKDIKKKGDGSSFDEMQSKMRRKQASHEAKGGNQVKKFIKKKGKPQRPGKNRRQKMRR